jgi:hypothetical protein
MPKDIAVDCKKIGMQESRESVRTNALFVCLDVANLTTICALALRGARDSACAISRRAWSGGHRVTCELFLLFAILAALLILVQTLKLSEQPTNTLAR